MIGMEFLYAWFVGILLFSHELILISGSLLQLETEVPQGLHPVEQKQGRVEFPFAEGNGCLSENNQLHDETEKPQEDGYPRHNPVLGNDADGQASNDH